MHCDWLMLWHYSNSHLEYAVGIHKRLSDLHTVIFPFCWWFKALAVLPVVLKSRKLNNGFVYKLSIMRNAVVFLRGLARNCCGDVSVLWENCTQTVCRGVLVDDLNFLFYLPLFRKKRTVINRLVVRACRCMCVCRCLEFLEWPAFTKRDVNVYLLDALWTSYFLPSTISIN